MSVNLGVLGLFLCSTTQRALGRTTSVERWRDLGTMWPDHLTVCMYMYTCILSEVHKISHVILTLYVNTNVHVVRVVC